ncbi:hypothetical protein BCR34DRAFT_592097 [Clohesyomyces aquaticus]|uniref:Uncharacterized protein n=1 Tax=Clohesyomyces aquaticus TaxID=1231657 RepID=A0A1Y1YVP6_9PLEO|nr:hypothetical protein BCR34DRAFT_592097 [Clohesyomyces aquaticus]
MYKEAVKKLIDAKQQLRHEKQQTLKNQGGLFCLNSSLILFFPTQEAHPPVRILDDKSLSDHERSKLHRLIKLLDIDRLSEEEAIWFGKALQIMRPELLADVPQKALDLLSDHPPCYTEFSGKDRDEYGSNPLQFFAYDSS